MKERECPHCGKKVDAAIEVNFEDTSPTEGDYSVCINCAGVSIYGPNLTLRKPSHLEGLELYRNEDVRKAVFNIMGIKKL